MTRWRKVVSILLAAAATAESVLSFAQEKPAAIAPQPEANAKAARGNHTPVFEVKPGMLRVILIEPGSLEASRNQDVYCNVEGGTTIIKIVPEGQRVKKGEVVCELDSAALRDQLVNQRIRTKSADANYLNAKLTRGVAEIAVKEYQEAIYIQDKATIRGEIFRADSDQARAEDQLDRVWRARERLNVILAAKGEDRTAVEIAAEIYVNDQVQRAQIAVARAKFDKERAHSKEAVLEKYENPKRIRELQSDVKKSLSDELAKQATWELEKGKEDKLEKQIAFCTLVAPIDGPVVYGYDPMRSLGSNRWQIEEGATVGERQKIFSVPDLGAPLLVNTKVRETFVARITPGQRVRVKVHGLPAEALTGVVESVAPLPDSTNFWQPQSDLRVYSTRVGIEKSHPGLHPGLSAQVEMLLTDLDDVLSVPFQAVLEHKDKDYVYLITPDGPARREVQLGLFNDTMIEVKEGLREGDQVALDPIALMAETELREAFAVSKEARARKASPAAAKAGRAAPAVDPRLRTQMFRKLQNLTPEDRSKLFRSRSDQDRKAILKRAGFTDEELRAFEQMRQPIAPARPARGPGSSLGGGETPR
jgi:multidrug efflux pump subunit AcrA (membrane-fusion protein)